MYDTLATDKRMEQTTQTKLLGLVGAMLDGMVEQFEYRDIEVKYDHKTVYVQDCEGTLVGKMLVKGTPLLGIADWLEAKADLYGGEN